MRKSKLFIAIFAVIAVACITTAVCLSSDKTNASAESCEVLPDEPIAISYPLNATFVIPNAKIVYGEEQIDAQNAYLQYPNGTLHSGKSHVCDQTGLYTVVYMANHNNVILRAEKTFNVYQTSYTTDTDKSSVEYVDSLVTLPDAQGGIKVVLAEGDTFWYNNLLDLSASTKYTPVIKFAPYSQSILADNVFLEATYYIVRLTDFYDADNYVEISIGFDVANPTVGRLHPYAQASANGQPFAGMEPNSDGRVQGQRRIVNIDGQQYRVYYGLDDFGTYFEATPDKQVDGIPVNNADYYGWEIYYEASTKRVYIRNKINQMFITDFDEQKIYDTTLFGGFTTGEVMLSLYCKTYKTATATIEIESINGVSGNTLDDWNVVDITPPTITLSNQMDNFVIATGQPFTLFDAIARDINGNGRVERYVYYEYGTENEVLVPQQGNEFTPKQSGKYSVVYVARDTFGNESKKIVTCYANDMDGGLVQFDVTLSDTVDAGEYVDVSNYTVHSVNGGEFARVFYSFEDDFANEKPLDGAFFPSNVGQYRIIYEYGDAVSCSRLVKTVNSVASSNVSIANLVLPRYLIKSAEYTFEQVSARVYTAKYPIEVPLQVFASEDGNDYGTTPIDYESYFVNADTSVRFKYVYNGVTVAESDAIQVVDVGFDGNLRMADYFVGDFESTATGNDIKFTSFATTGSADLRFINAISLAQFNLDLSNARGFATLKVTLTDYRNSGYSVSVNIPADGIGNGYSVYYNGADNSIVYGKDKLYFDNGFAGDKVYLSLQAVGLNGKGEFCVERICNQYVSSDDYESVKPLLVGNEDLFGSHDFGEVITIKPIEITDVLTPFAKNNLKFSVTAPNGVTVTSDEGVLLNNCPYYQSYKVTLSQYGTYRVSYNYRDQFGNTQNNVITVYVTDRVAPQITINNGYDETTLVQITDSGDYVYTVQGFEVTDNLSARESISTQIVVFDPMGEIKPLGDATAITLDCEGTWTVVYYATDESGNYAVRYYLVQLIKEVK